MTLRDQTLPSLADQKDHSSVSADRLETVLQHRSDHFSDAAGFGECGGCELQTLEAVAGALAGCRRQMLLVDASVRANPTDDSVVTLDRLTAHLKPAVLTVFRPQAHLGNEWFLVV